MLPQFFGLALLLGQMPNDPTPFINRDLAQQWQAQKLTPADKTGDLEFLRRASLDLIGRVPTLAEQAAYRKDPPDKRRKLLVDRLLQHDDYARHWANVWSDLLLRSAGDADARQAFHGWLKQHFARNGSHKELAEKLLTATGTTRGNPAVHFFVQHRGLAIPEEEQERDGQYDMHPLTGHVVRVFHGRRLVCVQCHDHPFDEDLLQQHFHGVNLLFRQVEFTSKRIGKKEVEEISDNPLRNKSGLLPYERRNGAKHFMFPAFLGGKKIPVDYKGTRREFAAEQLVKHPDFARAYVNFAWAYLFGHALTHSAAYDDMGTHNEVVQEKIMDRLAGDFVKSGHDPKALLRWICNTDAYSLKCIANKTNAGPDAAVYLARQKARPLSRKQLAESLIVALTNENYVKRRDALRAELLAEFKPLSLAPLSHCEVEPFNPEGDVTVRRALWIMNGKMVNRELSAADGTVAKAIEKTGGASLKTVPGIAKAFYPIALCRDLSAMESRQLTNQQMFRLRVTSKTPSNTPEFWTAYCEDIFWALLNSNEFALNH